MSVGQVVVRHTVENTLADAVADTIVVADMQLVEVQMQGEADSRARPAAELAVGHVALIRTDMMVVVDKSIAEEEPEVVEHVAVNRTVFEGTEEADTAVRRDSEFERDVVEYGVVAAAAAGVGEVPKQQVVYANPQVRLLWRWWEAVLEPTKSREAPQIVVGRKVRTKKGHMMVDCVVEPIVCVLVVSDAENVMAHGKERWKKLRQARRLAKMSLF